jgi:hypothetical protein
VRQFTVQAQPHPMRQAFGVMMLGLGCIDMTLACPLNP